VLGARFLTRARGGPRSSAAHRARPRPTRPNRPSSSSELRLNHRMRLVAGCGTHHCDGEPPRPLVSRQSLQRSQPRQCGRRAQASLRAPKFWLARRWRAERRRVLTPLVPFHFDSPVFLESEHGPLHPARLSLCLARAHSLLALVGLTDPAEDDGQDHVSRLELL